MFHFINDWLFPKEQKSIAEEAGWDNEQYYSFQDIIVQNNKLNQNEDIFSLPCSGLFIQNTFWRA